MKLKETLIQELQHEAVSTRKMLERLPAEELSWRPHEKSMSLGRLAIHMAEIPGWVSNVVNDDELDFSKLNYKPTSAESGEQAVRLFDGMLAKAVEALQNAKEEDLMKKWTMRDGETIFLTLPRVEVLRSFVYSHLIHHRGQLSVYLRFLDVKLPATYGSSADEEGDM